MRRAGGDVLAVPLLPVADGMTRPASPEPGVGLHVGGAGADITTFLQSCRLDKYRVRAARAHRGLAKRFICFAGEDCLSNSP